MCDCFVQYKYFITFRLPDHVVETEPKKSKLPKPRVTSGATVSKTVTKQPRTTQKSYEEFTGTSSNEAAKRDHIIVEKVMVGEAVPCGSSGHLFGSGQDPFAMVETLQYSMISPRPLSLPVNDGHLNPEASSSPLSSVGSLASYEEIQARLGVIGEEGVKNKGLSKKGKSSKLSSNKQKGPHKAKLPGGKDKFGAALLGKSSSVKPSSIISEITKSGGTKWRTKTPEHHSKGESSKQVASHGEISRGRYPKIPNLDYMSGRQTQVTFNNETVIITQYELKS